MKLLYVAPSAYLLGGVQDWLADLVVDQRRLGLDVTVAVPDDSIHRLRPYAERYPQLKPIAFRNPTGSEAGRIAALERLLTAHPEHLVVGVNIAALYPAIRRLRRKGDFRGHGVMTLHAIEPEYFADLNDQKDILDAVVVTNRLTGALSQRLGGMAAERVLYAPYGVAVTEGVRASGAPGDRRADRPGPILEASVRIAWVGRLDQAQKRVQDLAPILTALDAQSTPFQLSIAGDGPERGTLTTLLAPWVESGQVSLLGSIPRQDLAGRVYGNHDALLITSAWETGPIVAWEAMAAGMAVVSSRYVGSGLEGALIHDRTALLFEAGDASQAATQLGQIQNATRLRELAGAGRDLVQRRYSREASLAAWMAAFKTVAARPPLPPPTQDVPIAPAGGLDRHLGTRTAERFRRILGRSFRHREAGSEWPHSGHGTSQSGSLLAMATELDQGGTSDG